MASSHRFQITALSTLLVHERSTLHPAELMWMRKTAFLEAHGYVLEPIDQPSKQETSCYGKHLKAFQDATIWDESAITATRFSNRQSVLIRRLNTAGEELKVVNHLMSECSSRQLRMPFVPPIECFNDDEQPDITYVVTPHLRSIAGEPLQTLEDALIFVDQLLENLANMCRMYITHRDLKPANIVFCDCNDVSLKDSSLPVPRTYYIVDSGLSVHVEPKKTCQLRDSRSFHIPGPADRIQLVPEASLATLYDPLSSDLFMAGEIIRSVIFNKYENRVTQFHTIISFISAEWPSRRQEAFLARAHWHGVRSLIPAIETRWHLQPRHEPYLPRLVRSCRSLARLRKEFGSLKVLQYLCSENRRNPSIYDVLFVFAGVVAITSCSLRAAVFILR